MTITRIPRQNHRGSALLVAVVFLLLAGIMTLFALNVGVFENRSTGNDIRAKLVNEVAEAGLSQGFEYLMRQQPAMLEDASQWVRCGANETAYPCGAVSAALYDHDFDATTAPVTRRETMWKLVDGGRGGSDFDSAMVPAMLDLPNAIGQVGAGAESGAGFPVAYGVAPVVCFVAPRKVGELNTAPIRCATDIDQASNRRIATFVSVARMPNESARTTMTQTVGLFALVDSPAAKPPVVASGSVDVTGGLQIVTNPNSGGPGVPVSVWTRKDVDKTGTPNTCYADEFFRFGAKNNAPPTFAGTGENKSIICDTCQCNGDKSLSYDKSGNLQDEGIDILDVEGNSSVNGTGVNYNVRSDSLSYPTCEFPPDLFSHIFGTQAWLDNDHDCFAEVKVMGTFTNPNTGAQITLGADEAFLFSYAETVINPTAATLALNALTAEQRAITTYPSTALSGLVWCQSNCDIGSNTVVGSVDNPVVLVIDGSARIQGKVYGLVFIRTTAGGTLTPAAGYTLNATAIAAGGNAVLDMNAGAIVYGAMVVQGQVDKANGTAAIVHDENILNRIGDADNNNRFATLPGAWNDTISY